MAKVQVKFDRNKIIRDNRKKSDIAMYKLKSEIAKDTEKYIPFRDGSLRRSVDKSVRDRGSKLIYDKVYAAFQWAGKVMVGIHTNRPWAKKGEVKKVTNRNLSYGQHGTGKQWFIVSKRVNRLKWIKFAKKVFKNGK